MLDEKFSRYSALDSACMVEIHDKFWPDMAEGGYEPTYRMTMDLMPVLSFMQARGMRVNLELLEETKRDVLASAKAKQEELDRLVGHPLNVNSSKQVQAYFYGELGLAPIYKLKTKKVTTDDLAMQRLARGTEKFPGLRQAKLVQDIRGLEKLYGTYLDITFDPDDRMRGAYNLRGTKFGRLSCGKTVFDTGMNYQNLPAEFKKFLVADEGYMLLEVDKRQAEWVVVAHTCGDPNMLKAIREGLDVHTWTAHMMFGLPTEVIRADAEACGHSTDSERIAMARVNDDYLRKWYSSKWPRTMSLRQCGKKSNHGLNYDEGPNQFALLNEITPKEAKTVIDMYFGGYPGIKKGHEATRRQLQTDRTLSNCFGRKVRFLGEWGSDLWKSAYSFVPQSTVVDSLNQGMVKIYSDELITRTWDVDILAQVHDSILLQVPLRVVRDASLFRSLMDKINEYTSPTLSYNGMDFKIATDAKIGFNWGEHDPKNPDRNQEGMRDCTSYKDVTKLLALRNGDGEGAK